jgi:hypothetical protein
VKPYKRRNKKVSEDAPERKGTPVVSEIYTSSFSWGGDGD